MVPISVWKTLLYPVVSRAVLGEVKVSKKVRSKIHSITSEIEKYSEAFEDFNMNNPASWAIAASRGIETIIQEETVSSLHWDKFASIANFKEVTDCRPIHIVDLIKHIDMVEIWRSDQYVTYRVKEVSYDLFFKIHKNGEWNWRVYYIPNDKAKGRTPEDVESDVIELYSDAIYDYYGKFLELEYNNRSYSYVPKSTEIKKKKFYGKQRAIFSYLKKSKEKGVRRSILLQGRPGMGKSVLAAESSRVLGLRTIVINNDILARMGQGSWKSVIKFYKPEMIIVDDVDRVDHLENKLSLFEEDNTECVNFIFFTSNNIDDIPDAFKRPGRIDNIIVVEPPSREDCKKIINKLAVREKAARFVTDDIMETCVDIALQMSFAHVVEYLRQLYIYDGDIQEFEGDKTFEILKESQESQTEKVQPKEEGEILEDKQRIVKDILKKDEKLRAQLAKMGLMQEWTDN